MSAPPDIVLRARDITQTYGVTRALKRVNFEVTRGKVTTLFGENGAGKSTLMKILAGIEVPTSGTLELDGVHQQFGSATDARDKGISIIHQELSLCPNLSVQDNIFMGRELRRAFGAVDFAAERRIVIELLERLEEKIAPNTLVSDLRLGQQQIVEIARALSANSRILIMDEPTSALSASEVEVLFKVIQDLTANGVSIVYISHHLEEALQISDYVVVLRDGELVAAEDADKVDLEWVVEKMVGRNFGLGEPPSTENIGAVALSIEKVRVADPSTVGRLAVTDFSLQVAAGEIVCLYGLMGAGRTELLEALAGRVPLVSGRVRLEGQDLRGRPIAERIELGLSLVPEDRQRDGLIPTMSVGHNLSLASLANVAKSFWLSAGREGQLVDEEIKAVRVKTPGPGAEIGALSGGNQQKVVIGKLLLTRPKVLLLDEPTRGIDVGAKAEVFGLLTELAKEGLAVLYSTSVVNEALSIAHRVIVMGKGLVLGEFDTATVSRAEVMAASGESAISTSNGREL